ncbi:hypothetical protein FA13DRAFT_1735632 [Coprinellus micaceus]|uniref:Uncharacterized protein n=1 Tax=Coprinellus micaceus TaxID=71717 RepID=A0A4Y7T4G8_COPMI|nr:hypothetical protein FA13DRAFT_1735632 [Coprinellus micaceus]
MGTAIRGHICRVAGMSHGSVAFLPPTEAQDDGKWGRFYGPQGHSYDRAPAAPCHPRLARWLKWPIISSSMERGRNSRYCLDL